MLVASSEATCTWDPDITGSGGAVTVDVYRLAGGTSVNSGRPLDGSPLSNANPHAYLTPGAYLFVASGTAANGRLECRGLR
jgi:hypothetical protein